MIDSLTIERRRVAIDCKGGRTQQHQKDEADINQIMRKFQKTGLVNHLAKGHPSYGDFTVVTDYQTALEQVEQAHQSFMALPANIRRRFSNNPGELVAFMSDENNREEGEQLGLFPKKAKPVEAEPAPTPETPSVNRGESPPGVTQTS